MRKNEKRFLVTILVLLAAYCLLALLLPFAKGPVYWVAFGCGAAAILLTAVVFFALLRRRFTAKSRLFGFSVALLCLLYLLLQLAGSFAVMALGERVPLWGAAAVFGVLLVLAVLGSLPGAKSEDGGKRPAAPKKPEGIKALQERVSTLGPLCKKPEDSRAINSLVAAFRYSDPTGGEALREVEAELEKAVSALEEAVKKGSGIEELSRSAQALLKERTRLQKQKP